MAFSMTVVSTATGSRLAFSKAPDLRLASMVLVSSHSTPSSPMRLRQRTSELGSMGGGAVKERLAGEVLPVGVLAAARDHRLVRQPEGVLQVEQSRHQPRRGRGPIGDRGEEPRPFALEEISVDQPDQRHQLMAIRSTSRGRRRSYCSGGRRRCFMAAVRNCSVAIPIL